MEFQDFLVTLILIAGTVFLVVGIFVLLNLLKTLRAMRTETVRFREDAAPLLQKLHEVADEAQKSLEMISRNGESITASIERVKSIVDNTHHLHDLLYRQLAPSVIGLASTLAGIRRGLQTFFDQLRRPS